MKSKGKRKAPRKKFKKAEKLLSVENNNYHQKKIKENEKKEIQKIDEAEIRENLINIYNLIKNKNYTKKPTELYLNMTESPLINKDNEKALQKISAITQYKLISPIEIIYKNNYEKINKISNEKDKCSICQYNFYDFEEEESNKDNKSKENDEVKLEEFDELIKKEIDVILLNNCHDHFFHINCLDMLIGDKNNFKCPNCSIIYGILIGEQPNGFMSAYISNSTHCDGYEDVGTIIIDYHFPSGKNYSGTSRTAYLPNNKEGKEILGLLKVSFDRKLTFVVGTSVTTGARNTTVWNGIHHKTNLYGGSTNFGYPDKTYFNRVKEELAAKGVIQDNIDEDVIKIADDLLNGK